MKPVRNRTLMRNPYMQIARKIISTHTERIEDIKAIEQDVERLKADKQPAVSESHISEIVPYSDGKLTIRKENQIRVLEHHKERLDLTVRLTEEAFRKSVEDIEDEKVKDKVIECIQRYICNYREKQEEFNYLNYPGSRRDFDIRRRFVLKYIVRGLGLMPYVRQPQSVGKVKDD